MWRDFTIAADGGEPVAMCHVQGDLVAAIHVDPDLKGQGIGSRLMAEAEERIATGYRQARLEVLAFNRAARQFYQSRGWVERRRFDGTESGAPVELVEMRLELRRSETRGRR
jgi:ribosomal protein S18 acetylase RimI-like enzyme